MAHIASEIKRTIDTLRDDLRDSALGATFRREAREISEFYLSPEQHKQLKKMTALGRIVYCTLWILQALFFRLTPLRRMLFVAGIIFIISISNASGSTNGIVGGFLLVLVILLELKDKLLAHHELREGRQIQELLMPEQVQHFEGWSAYLYTRPANEVCGDLVDYLRLENGHAAVAIADVSGKGLHAALLTAKLQSTIRALAFDAPSLTELIARINTIFHRDSPSRIFASLLYAQITENDGTVRFVNAGHLPPFLIRKGAVTETEKGDLAIGLVGRASYREHCVELEEGDMLVLYSDGVTEARNEQGEFFGRDRLLASLTRAASLLPDRLCRQLVYDVDSFTGLAHRSDDLSLVIVRRL
ncbi:MAG: PP2C family protein-serine/threonine phosphatase [Acidobacteriota bacterium]